MGGVAGDDFNQGIDMNEHRPTRLQRAVKMDTVPAEKWPRVVQRTITGTVLIGFGVAGAALWGFPWYVAAGSVGLGATVWSTQLVTQSLKALLGPFRAYKRAMREDEPHG